MQGKRKGKSFPAKQPLAEGDKNQPAGEAGLTAPEAED